MNIKEIAQLAGVSISTVSKIINNKDCNISAATRQKVLDIVKKYNYSPYYNLKNNSLNNTKSFTIGILLSGNEESLIRLSPLIKSLQTLGYTALVLDSNLDIDIQNKNIQLIISKNVDGLIFEPIDSNFEEEISFLRKNNIKTLIIHDKEYDSNEFNINYLYLDYSIISFKCANELLKKHHKKILYLDDLNDINNNIKLKKRTELISGIKEAYFSHNIDYNSFKCNDINESDWQADLKSKSYSAIILPNIKYFNRLMYFINSNGIKIPSELSVIFINDTENSLIESNISYIDINVSLYNEYIANAIIDKLENNSIENYNYSYDYCIINKDAIININDDKASKKFLVIGSINIDLFLHIDKFPSKGSLTLAKNQAVYPGGKGANQTIGISRLGADVTIIGKVGDDYEASIIYNCMNENNIKINTITKVQNTTTGKAYVFLTENGDSSITLLSGANEYIKSEDIYLYEQEFKNSHYCLLPGELPYKTILSAAKIAKKHSCITIMKPAYIKSISKNLLTFIDFFIPNLEEAKNLAPGYEAVEDIARYLRKLGTGNVIITLEDRGCYIDSDEFKGYVGQNKFNVIDTTGGADAFISSFCVYLSKGYKIKTAAQIANYAAGFCVSKIGVIPALIDKDSLESYITKETKIKLIK